MTLAPSVSVCIANYNGVAFIDGCLRSVMQQLGDVACEILIHDDASIDGSAEYIRSHYPFALLIVSESNVGFCIANNRMAAVARGDYLLLLNNDACLYPDALQSLLAEARRLGKPAILTLPQYDAATTVLVDRGCLLDPFYNPVPNLHPDRQDVAMVIGACLWIPRNLWIELDGFPEWFGSIAEDMYLCCRARLAGHAVRVLRESGYLHWQGKSFGGNRVEHGRLNTNIRRRYLSERNKMYTLIATYPECIWLIAMPLHLVLSGIEAVILSITTKNIRVAQDIYAAAWTAVFQQLASLLQLRRKIRKSVTISFFQEIAVFYPVHQKLSLLLRHGLPTIRN